MPMYLSRFSYTPETWTRLVANPEDRRNAARSSAAFGGRRPLDRGSRASARRSTYAAIQPSISGESKKRAPYAESSSARACG